jgi:GNAT superfamily N-acetyltransferase
MDPPSVTVRWPLPEDRLAPFEAGGGLAGRLDWVGLLEHQDPERGRFALIAECAGAVVGAARATAYPDELEIEFLARNASSQAARGQRVGHALIEAAVALAWGLGIFCLTLESLDEPALIAFYEGEGFVRAGSPLFDAYWGTLHPMRRPLSSGLP